MLHKSLSSIPEAVEEHQGSAVKERISRLSSLSDLGPADLCTIRKVSAQSQKITNTFLYYTGVDTSNSAVIAAHLSELASLITSRSQYWFGEKKHWKVPELTYCTFNAFSRVDMHVTVHIPGKFEAVVVEQNGRILPPDTPGVNMDQLWLETFVSSMVRCLLDCDDDDTNLLGGLVEIRRENPFGNGKSSKELLANFVAGFERLFWDGPKLGCNIDIPQPTVTSNYLVDGFLKCVQLTQNFDHALEVLKRLEIDEPTVATLIAKVLLMKDQEITAVQIIHQGVANNPRNSELLLLEVEFLMDKKRYDLALHLAKQAVEASPSDFRTWASLVQVYTKLGEYEKALLSLNSCPMSAHKENFAIRRVIPLKGGADDLHLPSPVDVTLEDVSKLQSVAIASEQKILSPQLANLPAANLKSTYARAYDLLAEIAANTGWDALLKHRAKVFVMEEEYRKDKQNGKRDSVSEPVNGASQDEDGSADPNLISAPDDASTTAVKSPVRDGAALPESDMIKKRLCDRWLDNLFMLLYEDLRLFTVWQAEVVHFQAQQAEYKKTTLEWEILGQLAFRLKHYKEGSVAFNNALQGRFSSKAQRKLLSYYETERNKLLAKSVGSGGKAAGQNINKTMDQYNHKILEGCIKMMVWNHRWYSDFSPALINSVNDLVAKEGLIKIESYVKGLYSTQRSAEGGPNQGVIDMMEGIFDYCREFGIQGYDS